MPLVIGGIQPCSFVDYPGELAAVLFLHGCNLRCAWCHNPELVTGRARQAVALDEVMDLLRRRRSRLGAVVVTGGEPCVHPELPALLAGIRELGYRVKLDTNGTRPGRLAALLTARLVDYIAMDLKDIPEAYATVGSNARGGRVRRSIGLLVTTDLAHEFRTTVHLPHFDAGRLQLMADALAGCQRWYLQGYREPARRLDPAAECRPPPRELLEAWARAVRDRGVSCAVR